MKVKKVLFLCSVYKPHVGGVEIALEQTIRQLRKKGIESVILTKRFPKDLAAFEMVDDTPVYRIDRPLNDADFQTVVANLLTHESELRADVVHIIGIRRPMPLFGLMLARRWNVPYVVTFAGNDLPHYDDPESMRLWEEGVSTVPDSVRQADQWTAFAHHTAHLAQDTLGLISMPQVVYGGIDLEAIQNTEAMPTDHPYFFSARRLEKSKGLDLLITAFAKVSPQLPGYHLLIAGDGGEKAELEKLANTLGVQEKVTFLGSIRQAEVFAYMKGAVAHICPSRAESGGLVNYEAQAAGCIAIGSNVDGIPEYIVDGKTGILFQIDRVEDLAEKLTLAAENGSEIQKIRATALEESRTHGWDMFAQCYIDLYETLAARQLRRDAELEAESVEMLTPSTTM